MFGITLASLVGAITAFIAAVVISIQFDIK